MSITIGAERNLTIGEPIEILSDSPNGKFGVFFQDDGRVAWCYAFDLQIAQDEVQNGLHIYNTPDMARHTQTAKIQLVWSQTGAKAAVLVNQEPYAIFDFHERRGSCRSGLGLAELGSEGCQDWDEAAWQGFK